MFREFVCAKQRSTEEATRDAAQAWWIGARCGQAWAGKLPDLKTVLAKVTMHESKQTVTQQRSVLAMLSARYGIPLRQTRLVKVQPRG